MTCLLFGSTKATREQSRRRVCLTCIRLIMQSRVARKKAVLSNLRSHSASVLRRTTVPPGIETRVLPPHASRSQISLVLISQQVPLPLRNTKSSGRRTRSSYSETGSVGSSCSNCSTVLQVGIALRRSERDEFPAKRYLQRGDRNRGVSCDPWTRVPGLLKLDGYEGRRTYLCRGRSLESCLDIFNGDDILHEGHTCEF